MAYRPHIRSVLVVIFLIVVPGDLSAQMPGAAGTRTPSFGAIDPCAGTGAVGSAGYGACQLRQQTLSRGVVRPSDLGAIDRAARLEVERLCDADRTRGADIFSACVRRELGTRGYDPNVPVRPLPETHRQDSKSDSP